MQIGDINLIEASSSSKRGRLAVTQPQPRLLRHCLDHASTTQSMSGNRFVKLDCTLLSAVISACPDLA
jgi:hypothetical protein